MHKPSDISEYNLSKIGLGTYNMSVDHKEHYDSMAYAIKLGCNVIDTASNYVNGKSEMLIGKYIANNPGDKLFIITKAGYVSKEDIQYFKSKKSNLFIKKHFFFNNESTHCIYPDFLKHKIQVSQQRLHRKSLDGFLLHNPEYFLDQLISSEITNNQNIYTKIKSAFEFLEECVSKGSIKYYGVSSNSLSYSEKKGINTEELVRIANDVSINNYFKLAQFPYNVIENSASIKKDGTNLLQYLNKQQIISFTNRPLNVHHPTEGFIRLATYSNGIVANKEIEKGHRVLEVFLEVLSNQLIKIGINEQASDFQVVKLLNEKWNMIGNQAAVDVIFNRHLIPLLNQLFSCTIEPYSFYSHRLPKKVQNSVLNLYKIAVKFSKYTMTNKCNTLVNQLREQGILNPSDKHSIPTQVCNNYLDAGVDHILVGMRKKKYINDFKIFLK